MKFSAFVFMILFALCCLLGKTSMAQGSKRTLSEIQALGDDSSKVKALIELYRDTYLNTDDSIESGLKHILQAYYISKHIKYKSGLMESAYLIGNNFYYNKNMSKAIDFHFIALKLSKDLGDAPLEGKVLMSLGLVFYVQKNWKEAIQYFDKSMQVLKSTTEVKRLNKLAYLKGLSYNEMGDHEQARQLLNLAWSKANELSDTGLVYECNLGLAKVDYGLKRYDSAIVKYHASQQYYEENKSKTPLAIIHEGKAKVYFAQHKLKDALRESIQAYQYAAGTSFNVNLQEITSLLSTVYYEMGARDSAFHYLQEYVKIKDSLFIQDVSEKVAITNSNAEFEQKERDYEEEIERNTRRRNVAFAFVTILAIFILFGFVAYATLRKERKKSEELLLNILPRETADELKKFGKTIPKNHPSATVMFCDVLGFTNISASMTAESIVNMLDFYFQKFDEIITQHGLEKIKTIGDAYMCAGGLHPNGPNENHAEKTIDAAWDICEFVRQSEAEMIAIYGHAFKFRIGINSGNVVSGVVGSKKYAYDIWGDTVNVASRMEQTSEPGRINITGETYQLVKDRYRFEYRGKIIAKNKGELDMYFVESKI